MSSSLKERSQSVLLCGMIGDALGAPVEGWPASFIRKIHGKVDKYLSGKPLGISEVRKGMYTDDTNCALSIAASIVRMNGKIDAHDCAKSHVEFYDHKPLRGYPGTAIAVIDALRFGQPAEETGTLSFADGSFANGGAMKIGAVGVLHYNSDNETLLENVKKAILSTHVHPEAIDGAFIIAKGVSYLLNTNSLDDFDPNDFLKTLFDICITNEMKKRISLLMKHCGKSTFDGIFIGLGDKADSPSIESYGELDFQIKAVVAVACALWSFVGNWKDPLKCIVEAISLGGDTDTIATMVGYLVGALHGKQWIPSHLLDGLENGEYGRDYCILISEKLSTFIE